MRDWPLCPLRAGPRAGPMPARRNSILPLHGVSRELHATGIGPPHPCGVRSGTSPLDGPCVCRPCATRARRDSRSACTAPGTLLALSSAGRTAAWTAVRAGTARRRRRAHAAIVPGQSRRRSWRRSRRRRPAVAAHCRRVSAFSVRLAMQYELDRDTIETIRLGALLHDVGKMLIPARDPRQAGPAHRPRVAGTEDPPAAGDGHRAPGGVRR